MSVAKNWTLTITLIALAFAHFSSELSLKEQMIIPVKKTLNNAGHIDAKLIDFSEISQKKSSEIGCFLLIVSWRSFPPKFPVKSANFLRISPENPSKFDFSLLKSHEIGRFFCEFWLFSRKISRFFRKFWLFSHQNPMKSANFPTNLPLKIPWNFAFFPQNTEALGDSGH